MKFYILFTLVFFFGIDSFSQKVWFNDDFKDNRNGWDIRSEEFLKVSIKDGHYTINKESGDFWMTWKIIFIDPAKDFEIKTEMMFSSQNPKSEYAFIWSAKDFDNYNSFSITGNGGVFIKQIVKSKSVVVFKTILDKINIPKKYNALSVSRKADSLLFSINDSIIFRTLYTTLPINRYNVGFGLNGIGKLQVNTIFIKQDNEIHTLDSMPKGLIKRNLGQNINTKGMEAVPVISADGKTLYWAVKGDPKNTNSPDKFDIWYSNSIGDSAWTKRKNIGTPINNEGHNWVISVSPDNNLLLLANKYNTDGSYKDGIGISQANRSKTGWEVPKDVVINEFENFSKYAQYCLSTDRKILIQAIEKEDSKGDQDLYVSVLQEDGTFSEPKNMGVINTKGRECTPFLAVDGTTLYFSTNGRPGYGDNDIFVTTRTDNTWTNWSEPANLGSEINTPNFDADYTIPASGKFSLMVSKDHSLGGSDIFRIDLPKSAGKPKAVILLKGRVLSSVTKEPIVAEISYSDLLTDQEVGIATSSPVDGSYNIVLPPGTDYSFLARKDGFLSESDHIYAIEITEYTEMVHDLYLIPLEVGVSVQMTNLFFETGKGLLMQESDAELNRLVKLLMENPQIEIQIEGYTDNTGSDKDNISLSQDRADAIRKYLVVASVDPRRVTAKGFGEVNPIATNDTEEGRSKNRRVEFKITKK